jgi:hypothetical protein
MMPSPALSNEDLEHQLTESFACLQAATCQWLVLLAEFDRRQGWAEWGIRSCAHWLNWKCGIDLGAAREKVRVAKALSELPKISHTFEQGRLSYSKVRAMTRVATSDNESELLNIALHGTAAQVEKLVRKYRQVRMADEVAERQHTGRFLSYRHDEDGSPVLTVRLPAEDGAILIKALEAALEEVPVSKEDVSAETRVDPYTEEGLDRASERRADALTIVAESFLSNGAASLSGGDRYQVMVHIDADGSAALDDGPILAAETARRVACDSSVIRVTANASGDPLDVGRKTRSIPPAIRRALRCRDGGCRFPGCTQRRFVDGHHIHHWADGGDTNLGNLVLLCRHHHRLVHEGGFTVERLDDGALRFLRPDGIPMQAFGGELPAQSQAVMQLLAAQHKANLQIDHRSCVTQWDGSQLDYDLAIEGLLTRDVGIAPTAL